MFADNLLNCMKNESAHVYERASRWCDERVDEAKTHISAFATDNHLDLTQMCFVTVGSIGRSEALDASDMDLVPIANSNDALKAYKDSDRALRQHLRDRMSVDISKGEQLTKPTTICKLVARERIGGSKDNNRHLTRRILVLTEGRQVAGEYDVHAVRKTILQAYGAEERSSGRHILSLCNDIARYYRTLCIEYKPKVEAQGSDWCTRNLKLRHSRKIWYFSTIVSIAKLAERHLRGGSEYEQELLEEFARSPVERLFRALEGVQRTELGQLLETYAFFLKFMSKDAHRRQLSEVSFEERYENELANPFPVMKLNSDLLHRHVVDIIEGMQQSTRRHVLDWFLL